MKPALVEAASLAFPTRSIFLTIRGKPIAGNRHDGFEAAGAGNQFTVWLVRHSQRKRGATDRLNLRSTAPVLDPTKAEVMIKRLVLTMRPSANTVQTASRRKSRHSRTQNAAGNSVDHTLQPPILSLIQLNPGSARLRVDMH